MNDDGVDGDGLVSRGPGLGRFKPSGDGPPPKSYRHVIIRHIAGGQLKIQKAHPGYYVVSTRDGRELGHVAWHSAGERLHQLRWWAFHLDESIAGCGHSEEEAAKCLLHLVPLEGSQ